MKWLTERARATDMQNAIGLSDEAARLVGLITVLAADTETRLEWAIWRMQEHNPEGKRHESDARPVTDLIDMLDVEARLWPNKEKCEFILLWCETARHAFQLRHSLAHGIPLKFTNGVSVFRNARWFGEIRKRPPSSFHIDVSNLAGVRDTFCLLAKIVALLSNPRIAMDALEVKSDLLALKEARSFVGELASGHNPTFEKY